MTNSITYDDLIQVSTAWGGATASAWTEGAGRYVEEAARILQQTGQQLLTQQQKFDIFATEQAKSFRNLAETANRWADAADTAGKGGIGDIMRKYGNKAATEANNVLSGVIDKKQWLDTFVADANLKLDGANQTIAKVGGTAAKAFGPIVDAAQMIVGAVEYSQTGDSINWENACAGVALSVGAAALAFAVLPAGLVAVVGAGIAAGAGSYFGGQYFQDLKNLLLESDWFISVSDAVTDTTIATLRASFNLAESQASPIILDLDGDGVVETTAKGQAGGGLYFDLDNSGYAERSGWVGADDGLLVRDLNANGQIDSGAELFGNHTVLASGSRAVNGFQALAELDANRDGVLNASDGEAFASLRIWKDTDGDGQTDAGELLTLAQAGVSALNVGYTEHGTQPALDAQGNQHRQTGSYVAADGSTRSMNDVWFAVDPGHTVDLNMVEVSAGIALRVQITTGIPSQIFRDINRSAANHPKWLLFSSKRRN